MDVNGINIEIERNWTWVYGSTYPVKEELKQQGFFWSVKRRAWYNRSIVEVKLNNGNGHGIKPTQHSTEHAQEAKTPIEMVKTKVKEKTLEEEVFEYIKTKETYPLISGEWLSKQEKLGKTFLQLKPQIDNLIEDSLETEKRVKESEKEKDLHDWVIARNKELRGSEQIKDPHKRIEKVNEIVKRYDEKADKNWVTSEQYAAQIRVKAKREIWKTKQEAELSEHDKALIEIEGKPKVEEQIKDFGKWIRENAQIADYQEVKDKLQAWITEFYKLDKGTDYIFERMGHEQIEIGISGLAGEFYEIAKNGWDLLETFEEWRVKETREEFERELYKTEQKEAWRTEEYGKTVNELKERFGMLNPM